MTLCWCRNVRLEVCMGVGKFDMGNGNGRWTAMIWMVGIGMGSRVKIEGINGNRIQFSCTTLHQTPSKSVRNWSRIDEQAYRISTQAVSHCSVEGHSWLASRDMPRAKIQSKCWGASYFQMLIAGFLFVSRSFQSLHPCRQQSKHVGRL